jgi:S-adenosylmethionine decarboxylase
VEEYISSLIRKYGLSEVARVYHSFGSENAFTGTAVLAESHLCIHTWPEYQMVTVDVYACNVSRDNSVAVRSLYAELEQTLLRPKQSEINVITRRRKLKL